jgi:DNA polymerase III alpha subunit
LTIIKIKLPNRTIYTDGTVICSAKAVEDVLYSGQPLDNVIVEPTWDAELYNASNKLLDTNFTQLLMSSEPVYGNYPWYQDWNTPIEFKDIRLEEYLISRCKNETEMKRVETELQMFYERDMYPVLHHLIYLVNYWRKNKVLWGVGRGSSVSSFVLFLIGINRINPIDYDLDISDFLK